MVVLPDGKMSSRNGTAVSFDQLRSTILAEIYKILKKYEGLWEPDELQNTAHKLAEGTLKYGMLSTDPTRQIVFNLQDWLSFEGNTGPYLMYCYARVQSILKKAADQNATPQTDHLDALGEATENELIRSIYDFNDTVANATVLNRPDTVANHLYAMCKGFNRFYKDVSVLRADSSKLRGARLALVDAFARTLKEGLGLLGITPPERM